MRRYYKTPYKPDGLMKVFNMGFHPTFLYIFPMLWFYSLPFNFVVDSIVLLIGFKIFGKQKVWHNWKKSILLSWLFGYLSDITASVMMFGFEFAIGSVRKGSIMNNPLGAPLPFACTLLSVLMAGFLIYILNAKVALRKTELDEKAKRKVALLMAIVTMPYLFFMPVQF